MWYSCIHRAYCMRYGSVNLTSWLIWPNPGSAKMQGQCLEGNAHNNLSPTVGISAKKKNIGWKSLVGKKNKGLTENKVLGKNWKCIRNRFLNAVNKTSRKNHCQKKPVLFKLEVESWSQFSFCCSGRNAAGSWSAAMSFPFRGSEKPIWRLYPVRFQTLLHLTLFEPAITKLNCTLSLFKFLHVLAKCICDHLAFSQIIVELTNPFCGVIKSSSLKLGLSFFATFHRSG